MPVVKKQQKTRPLIQKLGENILNNLSKLIAKCNASPGKEGEQICTIFWPEEDA